MRYWVVRIRYSQEKDESIPFTGLHDTKDKAKAEALELFQKTNQFAKDCEVIAVQLIETEPTIVEQYVGENL